MPFSPRNNDNDFVSRTVKEVDAAGGSSRRHTFGRWASQARGVASQAWAVGRAGMGILPYGYTQHTLRRYQVEIWDALFQNLEKMPRTEWFFKL